VQFNILMRILLYGWNYPDKCLHLKLGLYVHFEKESYQCYLDNSYQIQLAADEINLFLHVDRFDLLVLKLPPILFGSTESYQQNLEELVQALCIERDQIVTAIPHSKCTNTPYAQAAQHVLPTRECLQLNSCSFCSKHYLEKANLNFFMNYYQQSWKDVRSNSLQMPRSIVDSKCLKRTKSITFANTITKLTSLNLRGCKTITADGVKH
jgi:hypothetical protein